MLSFEARVLTGADVVPGPAVKAALLDVSDVIGHEIIAERIAFVGGAPHLARLGIDSDASRVSDARTIHPHEFPLRRVLEDVGAVELRRMRIRVVHIRA